MVAIKSSNTKKSNNVVCLFLKIAGPPLSRYALVLLKSLHYFSSPKEICHNKKSMDISSPTWPQFILPIETEAPRLNQPFLEI